MLQGNFKQVTCIVIVIKVAQLTSEYLYSYQSINYRQVGEAKN